MLTNHYLIKEKAYIILIWLENIYIKKISVLFNTHVQLESRKKNEKDSLLTSRSWNTHSKENGSSLFPNAGMSYARTRRSLKAQRVLDGLTSLTRLNNGAITDFQSLQPSNREMKEMSIKIKSCRSQNNQRNTDNRFL